MESLSLLISRYTVLSHRLCACSHTAVFHQYACAKIWNGSNLRAIATYRANLDLVLTKPSVVSNCCISLASKLPRQFFKKGVLLFLFISLFFSCRCMLELKFAIYYRAASLPPQASYAVLAVESQAFFKHFPHTNSISNSANMRNNYISLQSYLCACVHVKKKWRHKGSHSSSVSGLNHLVWFQTWKKAIGWCTVHPLKNTAV